MMLLVSPPAGKPVRFGKLIVAAGAGREERGSTRDSSDACDVRGGAESEA